MIALLVRPTHGRRKKRYLPMRIPINLKIMVMDDAAFKITTKSLAWMLNAQCLLNALPV
jgi:hypothetical protein